MKRINESVISGDVATFSPPMQYAAAGMVSPLAITPLRGSGAYATVDINGDIKAHITRPVFEEGYWLSKGAQKCGFARHRNPSNAYKCRFKVGTLELNTTKKYLEASRLFLNIEMFTNLTAINEGSHYRSIYFNKTIGEIEIPSIYRYAAIDDNGDTHIFTNKPLYQTTGAWTGKGQVKIAKAVFSENYTFPIYASDLLVRLFGVSRLDDIATPAMVKKWIIDEKAVEEIWSLYDFKKEVGFKNNYFNSGIEAIPGASDIPLAIHEGMRTQVVNFGNKDYGVPPDYTWAAISHYGLIQLFTEKPRFVKGVWKGKGRFDIGHCEFHPEVTAIDIEDLYWKLSNIKAGKFLSYKDHIIKRVYIDSESITDMWGLSEGRLDEASIKLQGDVIDLPDGYEYVAVDTNTDICVFKAEPKLSSGVWKGKGKKQIGVAVWNFSKLEGKPTTMKEAKPIIDELVSEFKFKIEDGLDLQKTLKKTGKFKYFFGKYSEIEKIK